ncbi:FOSX-like protein [Mya arenaria]|uniref:FOSX-like protein n=1 Tax=Mya arenaria TaxID=6604 RepID=A0ABY7F8K6_MYAAR|nr:fos-related antigen 2-like isoform X1 [Mya arenaria]XP_052769124.1 fos-related antigen 2-like isoform X1 [Mya arenaria]WAR18498.1 FOSX-like protein [Mya arenaria]
MYTEMEGESKYHVANILSGMANVGHSAVEVSTYATPTSVYGNGNGLSTTNTLTPTTLSNLEQTFIELQSVPPRTSQPSSLTQSGFVPPIVHSALPVRYSPSVHDDYYSDSGSSNSNDDYLPSQPKKIKIGDKTTTIMSKQEIENPLRKTHRRQIRDEEISVEEAARRNMRRERNKVAAAKCRQRRVDHTNILLNETEKLEQDQQQIEAEIQSLQQQKEQLEFILQAHSPICKVNGAALKIKKEVQMSEVPENLTVSKKIPATSAPTLSSRPSTLPLINRNLKSEFGSAGMSITTPSSGFYSMSLDTMVDHTGLTPLTGNMGHTGLTPLTGMPQSCSTEVSKKSSTSSENSDGMKTPSNLITL